ncbi:MAG TPA: chromate transporter [Chloroflexota bacterium]|nr:chromate transporter [Chloroflexota bacterium]
MLQLLELVLVFAPLSLVAVGGANTVLPDIHRQVVLTHGWMSETDFANAFVLAQAVPGPNILVVSLIGWQVAGLAGAIIAIVAMCAPSTILALLLARALGNLRLARWRRVLQAGLAPLTIGLMLASGLVLARSADHTVVSVGLTIITTAILLRTKLHPLLLMAGGAVLGLAGLT